LLLDVNGLVSNLLVNLDNVESNGLGQRSALADGDDIAFTEEESRGAVCCDILVTLFVPLVLPNILQVATTDNNGALHLGRHNDTLQNASANRNIAGEWALFVDVGAFDSSLRGLEAETDVLGPASLLDGLLADNLLGADEDSVLLLPKPCA